jgi:holliday junction DNA helicase RuvA
LISAIHTGDVEKLATVPGIGKKSAGRIALELKDKVGKIQPGLAPVSTTSQSHVDGPLDDACSALVNLGYRPQDAKAALKRVAEAMAKPLALKELIREGLKELARG